VLSGHEAPTVDPDAIVVARDLDGGRGEADVELLCYRARWIPSPATFSRMLNDGEGSDRVRVDIAA